ncbi:MAG: c-type cytochrome [Campylobacterales bacterium]|nr:c-type cytochrome [Campylobacterales bacterium]
MKTLLMILGLSALLLANDAASAYQKCASCHGATGEKSALGKSRIINTMPKAEIKTALKGYQDGSYGGPMKALMKGQVATLSDAQIELIAEHIGAQ